MSKIPRTAKQRERIALLKLYERRPDIFVQQIFGMTIFKHNLNLLMSEFKRIIYRAGRQSGKSNTISLYIIHRAIFAKKYLKPPAGETNIDILICAYTLPQAQLTLERIRRYMQASKFTQSRLIKHSTRKVVIDPLWWDGTVTIHCVALGATGDAGRGYTISILFIDEFPTIPEAKIQPVWPTIAARPDAVVFIAGTPKGAQGLFYTRCKGSRLGSDPIDDIYSKEKDTEWVQYCAISEQNPLVSKKFLESEKKALPHIIYRQEYEAAFEGVGRFWYPMEVLYRSVNAEPHEFEQGSRLVLGVDVSRLGSDETVFTTLQTDGTNSQLLDIQVKPNTLLDEIVSKIQSLHALHQYSEIYVEKNGMGAAVVDFGRKVGLPIIPVEMTPRSKVDMHVHCLHELESELLRLSMDGMDMHHSLIRQSSGLLRNVTKEGTLKLEAEEGKHDDYIASLALAARCTYRSVDIQMIDSDVVDEALGHEVPLPMYV